MKLRIAFALSFLLAASAAFAQRDLTMNVEVVNPSASAAQLHLIPWAKDPGTRVECDTKEFETIVPHGSHRFTCLIAPNQSGQRNVDITGRLSKIIRRSDPKKPICEFHFIVQHTHDFRSTAGCGIHEEWDCGPTGPCSVAVTVTIDE